MSTTKDYKISTVKEVKGGLSVLTKKGGVDECKSKSLDSGAAQVMAEAVRRHARRRSQRLSDADIVDLPRRISLQQTTTAPPTAPTVSH